MGTSWLIFAFGTYKPNALPVHPLAQGSLGYNGCKSCTCAVNVYQALFSSPLSGGESKKRTGDEARIHPIHVGGVATA